LPEYGQRLSSLSFAGLALIATAGPAADLPAPAGQIPGIAHTNVIVPAEPWSIHVARVSRAGFSYEIQSRHADAGALGMSTLSRQVADLNPEHGRPVAAINGGFYQRDKIYGGAARGLQIVEGEVLSAPGGGPCFWVDVGGEPHLTHIASQFQMTWPQGETTPFGLNEERRDGAVVLYTPAIGASTHTKGGLEFVLERQEGSRWLPLRVGRGLAARVRAIQTNGNTPLTPDIMVLSAGPNIMSRFQTIAVGAVLQVYPASSPSLSVARNALSGGPVLIHQGKQQKIRASPDDAYELSSMLERHPRTAIGWNKDWYYLVVVDGRQRDLSDGMTLDELATFLGKLGCDEALNLDGGGSSTLWFDGSVRNSPCDGYERPIANSLVVLQKEPKSTKRTAQNQARPSERTWPQ